jgi:hypothetical protein
MSFGGLMLLLFLAIFVGILLLQDYTHSASAQAGIGFSHDENPSTVVNDKGSEEGSRASDGASEAKHQRLGAAGKCSLLGGTVGYSCQFILFVVAFGSLIYKRYREEPKRTLTVWTMDVSKQVVSTGIAHLSGMFWSFIMKHYTVHSASECAWYFIMFSTDTTLGVLAAYLMHSQAVKFARSQGQLDSSEAGEGLEGSRIQRWLYYCGNCGEYGDPPQLMQYIPQMAEFCGVVLLARIMCGLLVYFSRVWLNKLAEAIDSPFVRNDSPNMELACVMILGPFIMNIIQAWIQDQYLKWDQHREEKLLSQDSLDILSEEGTPGSQCCCVIWTVLT